MDHNFAHLANKINRLTGLKYGYISSDDCNVEFSCISSSSESAFHYRTAFNRSMELNEVSSNLSLLIVVIYIRLQRIE